MFNFGCADTKGQGTKGAVCCCMAVATHDCRAGQGEALLWSNNVNDALAFVVHIEQRHTKLFTVF